MGSGRCGIRGTGGFWPGCGSELDVPELGLSQALRTLSGARSRFGLVWPALGNWSTPPLFPPLHPQAFGIEVGTEHSCVIAEASLVGDGVADGWAAEARVGWFGELAHVLSVPRHMAVPGVCGHWGRGRTPKGTWFCLQLQTCHSSYDDSGVHVPRLHSAPSPGRVS